jgi:predicted dehydrogenase
MAKPIAVGMIGYRFMGRAHSGAYRQVAAFFPEVRLRPVMRVLCGRDAAGVQTAAEQLGWERTATDWQAVVRDPTLDLIDIATPSDNHAEVAIAAARAGKHIWCEKPLARTVAEARAMCDAVAAADVIGIVNFNYRRVPAVQLAKHIIDSGQLGRVYHWRATYLQEWALDPTLPLVWRFDRAVAGSGAIGELGAHNIDLARMLVGEITSVTGMLTTFIPHRPRADAPDTPSDVQVDDSAAFLARFANGATGTFEISRVARGRLNANTFEINGERGSLVFNLERLNELGIFLDTDPPEQRGFRTVMVTEANHPYVGHWWPPGHIIGWEHTFTHGLADLLTGIATHTPPAPTFEDGLRTQIIVEAVERSAATRQWVEPDYR